MFDCLPHDLGSLSRPIRPQILWGVQDFKNLIKPVSYALLSNMKEDNCTVTTEECLLSALASAV